MKTMQKINHAILLSLMISPTLLAQKAEYWIKSVKIPDGNPVRQVDFGEDVPDTCVIVQRNGVVLVANAGWKLDPNDREETSNQEAWEATFPDEWVNRRVFDLSDKKATFSFNIYDGDPFGNDLLTTVETKAEYFYTKDENGKPTKKLLEEVVVYKKMPGMLKPLMVSITLVKKKIVE